MEPGSAFILHLKLGAILQTKCWTAGAFVQSDLHC